MIGATKHKSIVFGINTATAFLTASSELYIHLKEGNVKKIGNLDYPTIAGSVNNSLNPVTMTPSTVTPYLTKWQGFLQSLKEKKR